MAKNAEPTITIAKDDRKLLKQLLARAEHEEDHGNIEEAMRTVTVIQDIFKHYGHLLAEKTNAKQKR